MMYLFIYINNNNDNHVPSFQLIAFDIVHMPN